MITSQDHRLIIQHEENDTRINTLIGKCADAYIAEWLPRILAEDPSQSLEKLILKEFAWLSDEDRVAARQAVAVATPERIAARFTKMVKEQVGNHHGSSAQISFQSTLRIPDDGKTYPLPPGMGALPVRKLEAYGEKIPEAWRALGGVLLPMHQSEAMWLNFSSSWPTAVKIGTGTVNAINGAAWAQGLTSHPQGYVVLPEQPWLDGFCVGPGVVRQFIATRLGAGYTAEEQVLGSTRGGLQIEAFPVLPESYFQKKIRARLARTAEEVVRDFLRTTFPRLNESSMSFSLAPSIGMGLGGGGRIKQEIFKDQWEPTDWDLSRPSRVWVHLVDAAFWRVLTGLRPPTKPPTAAEYSAYGLPWFDYYRDDMEALEGSDILARLKSVSALAQKKQDPSIPSDPSPGSLQVKPLGPDAPSNAVSEWNGI